MKYNEWLQNVINNTNKITIIKTPNENIKPLSKRYDEEVIEIHKPIIKQIL